MGGNPNWWTNMHAYNYVLGSSIPFNSLSENPQPHPPSWSQLLFSGVPGGEERWGFDHFQAKKLGTSWDEQIQILNPALSRVHLVDGVKQEASSQSGSLYGHGHGGVEDFQGGSSGSRSAANWSHMVAVSSSPRSCVTNLSSNNNNSNNMLDFTCNNKPDHRKTQLTGDHTSECNSTASGGVAKKARVQPSSSQPPLKVRKEKLGDRITALHQLVSPFGKTDTASVLLEATGYIRFLQGQIEALSSPYLGNSSKNMRNQHSVHGERNCVFPEDPGQLLNDSGLKRNNGAPNQENGEGKAKDLKSRGLCLVPVSFTQHVGSENGADFWAPPFGSGF